MPHVFDASLSELPEPATRMQYCHDTFDDAGNLVRLNPGEEVILISENTRTLYQVTVVELTNEPKMPRSISLSLTKVKELGPAFSIGDKVYHRKRSRSTTGDGTILRIEGQAIIRAWVLWENMPKPRGYKIYNLVNLSKNERL